MTAPAPPAAPPGFAPLDPGEDHEACDVCAAPPPLEPHLAVSLMGVADAWVCRCPTCGFRQVRPRLGPGEIRSLYPTDYFDSRGTIGFGDYARQQQRYGREAFFLAKQLARIAPAGRLLEVGCALGFLLDALRRESRWETVGLDISPFAVHFARSRYNLDVRCATLDEAHLEANSFDFIIQKDLLEHVNNPRRHLEETRRLLRPGGQVLIVTPNGEANLRPLARLATRLAAAGHPASQPEDALPLIDQGHLSFFTAPNLRRLLADTGLVPVHFRTIRLKRGLRALGWTLSRRQRHHAVPAGRRRQAGSRPGDALAGSTAGAASSIDAPAAAPGGGAADPDPVAVETMNALARQIASELERHRSRVRGSRPYYAFRQMRERIVRLPGWLPLGNDFEILAKKI
ncbi:MAG: class I SAM-dependent methyltransferase [Acidobacteriota bacterium]